MRILIYMICYIKRGCRLKVVTEQFVPWNFEIFWKQSLDFAVMHIGTCMLVTQKNVSLKLMKTITKCFRFI